MYGEIAGAMGASVGLGTERLCAGTTTPLSTKARPHRRNDSKEREQGSRIDKEEERIDNQEISREQ